MQTPLLRAPHPLLWALALGVAGFAAGFFGPIVLVPEANQGPLLGIFITGPGGALMGLVLGTLLRLAPVTPRRRWQALLISAGLLIGGTLLYCLPEPRPSGSIVDVHTLACSAPTSMFAPALQRWNDAVAAAPWAEPPAQWREMAQHRISADNGVVLTMQVRRERPLYELRKPWNRGDVTASPWQDAGETRRYYLPAASCDAFTASGHQPALQYPRAAEGDAQWPPTSVPNFLGLLVLQPVPAAYRHLLDDG